ncbi:hypothetical protein EDC01DRAFT_750814 [Geopyxis carbonaria]|nr:hypothetical protein EDC01DRAFT_750814 [Geopyxis carbonaria]
MLRPCQLLHHHRHFHHLILYILLLLQLLPPTAAAAAAAAAEVTSNGLPAPPASAHISPASARLYLFFPPTTAAAPAKLQYIRTDKPFSTTSSSADIINLPPPPRPSRPPGSLRCDSAASYTPYLIPASGAGAADELYMLHSSCCAPLTLQKLSLPQAPSQQQKWTLQSLTPARASHGLVPSGAALAGGFVYAATSTVASPSKAAETVVARRLYQFGGACPAERPQAVANYSSALTSIDLPIVRTPGRRGPDIAALGQSIIARQNATPGRGHEWPVPEAGFSVSWLSTGNETEEGRAVVIGGRTATAQVGLEQLAVYNLPAQKWSFVNVAGAKVEPRTGHSAVVIPGGKVVVFGGYSHADDDDSGSKRQPASPSVLVLETACKPWKWRAATGGDKMQGGPEALYGHAAALLPDNETMLIAGGEAVESGKANIGLFLYNTTSGAWRTSYTPPGHHGTPPPADKPPSEAAGSQKKSKPVAGIAAGVVLALAAAGTAAFFILRRRRRRHNNRLHGLAESQLENSYAAATAAAIIAQKQLPPTPPPPGRRFSPIPEESDDEHYPYSPRRPHPRQQQLPPILRAGIPAPGAWYAPAPQTDEMFVPPPPVLPRRFVRTSKQFAWTPSRQERVGEVQPAARGSPLRDSLRDSFDELGVGRVVILGGGERGRGVLRVVNNVSPVHAAATDEENVGKMGEAGGVGEIVEVGEVGGSSFSSSDSILRLITQQSHHRHTPAPSALSRTDTRSSYSTPSSHYIPPSPSPAPYTTPSPEQIAAEVAAELAAEEAAEEEAEREKRMRIYRLTRELSDDTTDPDLEEWKTADEDEDEESERGSGGSSGIESGNRSGEGGGMKTWSPRSRFSADSTDGVGMAGGVEGVEGVGFV